MLAAGKSFLNGESAPTYREQKAPFVPVFNGGKNPFAARPATKKGIADATPNPVEPAAREARPSRASSWVEKINPFRAPEPMPSVVRPVQPELSLENVEVVRNDLREADIERVPAQSHTLPPPPARPSPGLWGLVPNAS